MVTNTWKIDSQLRILIAEAISRRWDSSSISESGRKLNEKGSTTCITLLTVNENMCVIIKWMNQQVTVLSYNGVQQFLTAMPSISICAHHSHFQCLVNPVPEYHSACKAISEMSSSTLNKSVPLKMKYNQNSGDTAWLVIRHAHQCTTCYKILFQHKGQVAVSSHWVTKF